MKRIILLGFFLVLHASVLSQNQSAQGSTMNIGLGIGIDYGGFGGRFTYLPVERVGLFAGLGYNLIGAGYNIGAMYRFMPSKRVCPTFGAMFGYNGVIKVENASEYDQAYYGVSISGGVEFRLRNNKNYINLELIIPFRSQEFQDDVDALKDNPSIEFKNEPIPVAFSVGYHFGF